MHYWYIWYEVYENGKRIPNTKGRYGTAYTHKSSAIRRARKMWGKDLYDPMTDSTIHREWIVSQFNPWDDVYIFNSRAEAEIAIYGLRKMAELYGCATRSDLMDIAGIAPRNGFLDYKYGWIVDMLKDADIKPRLCWGGVYIVEFPKALPIE